MSREQTASVSSKKYFFIPSLSSSRKPSYILSVNSFSTGAIYTFSIAFSAAEMASTRSNPAGFIWQLIVSG